MMFRKLVLLGGACTLLLAYHGGYWLSDWPWLFYYALVSWWFSFSWYIFITPKVPVVPGNINKNEKSLSIAGKPLTHRYKQSDSDDSSLIIHSIYLSSTNNVQSDSTINNGGDCSYSDTSDSGCSGGD